MSGELVWTDLETTGLDPNTDLILEISMIVTDRDLYTLGGPYTYQIKPEQEFIIKDHYVRNMHTKSHLLDEISLQGISLEETIMNIFSDLENSLPNDADYLKSIPLAGSSVHFDRAFLKVHMPELEKLFSHRNVDVSTIMELSRRWYQMTYDSGTRPAHRAEADILASIEALRVYRNEIFK